MKILGRQTPTSQDTAKDILKSLNDETAAARHVWIAFNSLMAFLMVTTIGITHEDLLFDRPVKLPIIDVGIPLSSFAVLAPLLMLILHFAVLIQHALLARKAIAFHELLKRVGHGEAAEEFRYRAGTYFFIQNILAPKQNALIKFGTRAMSWLTLDLLPLLLLLLIQFQFLPYQDNSITWSQRGIIATAAIMVFIGGLVRRQPERGIFAAIADLWWNNKKALAILTLLSVTTFCFSVFIGTGAHERGKWWDHSKLAQGSFIFNKALDDVSGRPASWFSQRLVLRKMDINSEPMKSNGGIFRGRNFVEADFSDSTLDGLDLTAANLRSADMSSVSLRCTEVTKVDLSAANFERAKLEFSVFNQSNIDGANFQFASLAGAIFQSTSAVLANFRYSSLAVAHTSGLSYQVSGDYAAPMFSGDGVDLRYATAIRFESLGISSWRADDTPFKMADVRGFQVWKPPNQVWTELIQDLRQASTNCKTFGSSAVEEYIASITSDKAPYEHGLTAKKIENLQRLEDRLFPDPANRANRSMWMIEETCNRPEIVEALVSQYFDRSIPNSGGGGSLGQGWFIGQALAETFGGCCGESRGDPNFDTRRFAQGIMACPAFVEISDEARGAIQFWAAR